MIINAKSQKFIISSLFAAALLTSFFSSADDPFENTPKLTLVGRAALQKPADQLKITVGVVTLAGDAKTALEQNNAGMDAVVAALKKTGLSDHELKTGRFTIHPTYTPAPKYPPQEWKPSINGYEVTNSLLVKTEQLKLAGAIIDAASQAGANAIDAITFDLKDPEKYRDEAIAEAAAAAIKEAKTLALATEQSLQRLLLVTLDETETTPFVRKTSPMMYMTANSGGESSTPVLAGDVTILASVTVVYEIAGEKKGQAGSFPPQEDSLQEKK